MGADLNTVLRRRLRCIKKNMQKTKGIKAVLLTCWKMSYVNVAQ